MMYTSIKTTGTYSYFNMCLRSFFIDLSCVNGQRDAKFYTQFYSRIFSALHVSNESSRSSSEALHNVPCFTVRYNRAGESSSFEIVGKTGTIRRAGKNNLMPKYINIKINGNNTKCPKKKEIIKKLPSNFT